MPDDIVVEFDQGVYSLDVLNAAAYRIIGVANCQIAQSDGKFVCRLVPKNSDPDVRSRFIDYVTDEGLRERIALKTEPLRNVILSLAFGALASRPYDTTE